MARKYEDPIVTLLTELEGQLERLTGEPVKQVFGLQNRFKECVDTLRQYNDESFANPEARYREAYNRLATASKAVMQ